jgi:hypothetical protein
MHRSRRCDTWRRFFEHQEAPQSAGGYAYVPQSFKDLRAAPKSRSADCELGSTARQEESRIPPRPEGWAPAWSDPYSRPHNRDSGNAPRATPTSDGDEWHDDAGGASACVPAPASPSKIAARAFALHLPDPLSTPGCLRAYRAPKRAKDSPAVAAGPHRPSSSGPQRTSSERSAHNQWYRRRRRRQDQRIPLRDELPRSSSAHCSRAQSSRM